MDKPNQVHSIVLSYLGESKMGARIWTSSAFVMVFLEFDKMILKISCDFIHPWAKPHFYHTSATAENIIRHWHSNPLHTGHRWPGQWSTMHPSTPCACPNLACAADNGVDINQSYTYSNSIVRVENWDWRELVTRTIEVTLTPISSRRHHTLARPQTQQTYDIMSTESACCQACCCAELPHTGTRHREIMFSLALCLWSQMNPLRTCSCLFYCWFLDIIYVFSYFYIM